MADKTIASVNQAMVETILILEVRERGRFPMLLVEEPHLRSFRIFGGVY